MFNIVIASPKGVAISFSMRLLRFRPPRLSARDGGQGTRNDLSINASVLSTRILNYNDVFNYSSVIDKGPGSIFFMDALNKSPCSGPAQNGLRQPVND